jgi:isoleucyl-tRNA synthetase
VARAVEELVPDQLRALEAGETATLHVNGTEVVYFPGDVEVQRDVATDWLVASDGPYVAALDPVLSPALAAEGLAREVVHHVQRLRREADLAVSDRIELGIEGPAALQEAATAYQRFIGTETLAREVCVGRPLAAAEITQAVDVDGQPVTISLRRHRAGA